MSEKRIIRRRRAGSTGSDSEEEEEVVLSGASQDEGVSKKSVYVSLSYCEIIVRLGWKCYSLWYQSLIILTVLKKLLGLF